MTIHRYPVTTAYSFACLLMAAATALAQAVR
jgi:hypothetical protein